MKRANEDYTAQRIVSERIKDILKEQKRQIKELSVSVWPHYTQPATSKILSNSQHMTIEDLRKVAKYLNVSADYLLGLTDEKEMKCATQDEAAPDPITPRDFCRMLLTMSDQEGYELCIKKVEGTDIFVGTPKRAVDEDEEIEEDGTSDIYCEKYETHLDYYALYFSLLPHGESIERYDSEGNPTYPLGESNYSAPAESIQIFLERYAKLRPLLEDGSIDRTDYDYLVEKHLRNVMDEYKK